MSIPPPPHLKPPTKAKIPRRNLTIKGEEFDEWLKIKGNHSWTGIMIEARKSHIKMQRIDVILQNLSKRGVSVAKGVWDNHQKPKTPSPLNPQAVKGKILQKEIIDELKAVFGSKDSFLKAVPEDELNGIKERRMERVKKKFQG